MSYTKTLTPAFETIGRRKRMTGVLAEVFDGTTLIHAQEYPNYSEAERATDALVYDLLSSDMVYSATQMDGGAGDPPAVVDVLPRTGLPNPLVRIQRADLDADSLFPPVEDPLPDPGPGGPGMPGDERPRYTRDPRFDKRIGRGDDYAGDAWRDARGLLRWVAVGHDPNYA